MNFLFEGWIGYRDGLYANSCHVSLGLCNYFPKK